MQAVAVHPDLKYSVVRVAQNNGQSDLYVIGSDRVNAFKEDISAVAVERLAEIQGVDLAGTLYEHPLSKQAMPIITGNHVTAESGTGLVHSAPGHGMEDYEVCQKAGIPPFSPGNALWKICVPKQ